MNVVDIDIRPVRDSDSKQLWEWRNDAHARRHSEFEDVITWEDHCKWFEYSLLNGNRTIIMGIESSSSDAIGMVRFDLTTDGDAAVVSLNMNPKWRNRKLSTPLLLQAIDAYSKDHVCVLQAQIKVDNFASIRCFEHCSFLVYKRNQEFLYFRNRDLVINAVKKSREGDNVD